MNSLRYDLAKLSKGARHVHFHNGRNTDIINTIHKAFPAAVEQMRSVLPAYKGNGPNDTAKRLWDFLKSLRYQADTTLTQKIKLPARLASDGIGDCKSYSLLAAAGMQAAGYPSLFRYSNYDGSPKPSHVYAITPTPNGEIIIDGVWSEFNDEKPPVKFFDYDPMRIETLTGIHKGGISGLVDGIFKLDDLRPENVNKLSEDTYSQDNSGFVSTLLGLLPDTSIKLPGGKYIGNPFYYPFRAVNVVLWLPGRVFFKTLMVGNYRNLADKYLKGDPANIIKLGRLWYFFGGEIVELINAAGEGVNTPPEMNFEEFLKALPKGISAEPTTTAAAGATVPVAVAEAGVVLLACQQLLKGFNGAFEESERAVDNVFGGQKDNTSGGGSSNAGSGTNWNIDTGNFNPDRNSNSSGGLLKMILGGTALYFIFK